jgi:hypothetical protein
MTYNIEDLSLEQVDLIALAMEYFHCNADLHEAVRDEVEVLFYCLDDFANDIHDAVNANRLINKRDNLLVVDFSPKNG